MGKLTGMQKLKRIMIWPHSPIRMAVCILINTNGFRGTFDQLVRLVDTRHKGRVAQVVGELFEAEVIDFIPPGTPHGALDGSASPALLVKETCIDASEAH